MARDYIYYRITTLSALFLLCLLLIGCSRDKKAANGNKPSAKKDAASGNDAPMSDSFVQNGDSITIPEFEVEVALSEAAEQKLKKAKESIIVQAYITGIPKEGVPVEVDNMGEIALANPKLELIDSRIAHFRKVNISRSDFDALADKEFRVLINVFSGRRSSDLNLLNCDILDEPISSVRAKRHILYGKLIDE